MTLLRYLNQQHRQLIDYKICTKSSSVLVFCCHFCYMYVEYNIIFSGLNFCGYIRPMKMRPFENLVCKTFPKKYLCIYGIHACSSIKYLSQFLQPHSSDPKNWQVNSCQQSNAVSLYTLHIVESRLDLVTCQGIGDNNNGIIQNRGTGRAHALPNRAFGQPNNYIKQEVTMLNLELKSTLHEKLHSQSLESDQCKLIV